MNAVEGIGMDQILRMMAHWRSHGIECPAGVSPDRIAAFESCHDVLLPTDLRVYFAAVNGMGDLGTCDNDLFHFLQIDNITTIAAFVPDRCSLFQDAERYFIIADHSISLPSYAIRLSSNLADQNPVASVFTDRGALQVEDFFGSFTDFVTHYLDHPVETSVTFPRMVSALINRAAGK
jgi:hypothetical protein